MSTIVYAVVFKGEVLEGFQTFAVKAHMANLLKADQQKMAQLFSGKQIVLKRTEDKNQALRLGGALKKIGADIKVRAIRTADASPAAGAADAALALAPNTGYLVESRPAPPPPDIDISGIELADLDAEPLLQQPHEVVELDLDLGEYMLAELSDEPLVPPKPEVPPVDAPDFGLDEPGAVLDTISEEIEEVDPDISSLSLAEAGADLLDPGDRPAGPEPAVPDISQIDLAPLPED